MHGFRRKRMGAQINGIREKRKESANTWIEIKREKKEQINK